MPGGYGTDESTPWGSAGTTSTPGPYSSPGGGNQGGPRHPGGYNPNLNPPVTVDYTSPVVDTSGINWDALINAGDTDNNVGITTLPSGTISVPETTTFSTNPTNLDDDIWDLAVQAAASNPGYELSAEGQKLKAAGIMPGSDQWVMHFGVPQIVTTSGRTGEPVTTGIRSGDTTTDYMDEYGQTIEGGKPIMTGLGAELLDQYDSPTGSYQEQVDDYYEMIEAEQAQQTGVDPNYGYGYDPGGGGGYPGGPGGWVDVKRFSRGRPENISPWARNIAGTPMLPVAGSGAGASMAAADELYALASGKKAFSMTPEEQGILALLNA